jgi:hypothetical protein
VVTAARAVADTAAAYQDLPAVRALVTSALQRRACTVGDLAAELDAGPWQHSRLFRLALADAAGGARSAAEAEAAHRLRSGGVAPFELNVPIVDEDGEIIYVVDVLWRHLRAALEIDSREYHFSVRDWQATLERHNELTRHGLAVTHYAPAVVLVRGPAWVSEVNDWLHRRAAEIGVASPHHLPLARQPADAEPEPFVVRRRSR